MDRNESRRHGRGRNNWNGRNHSGGAKQHGQRGAHSEQNVPDLRPQFHSHVAPVSRESIAENESAIRAFKENVPVCELCGQPITDISSAVSDKKSGKPVHFDCVLNKLNEQEKPGENDKITYIGSGKFAVLHFDNPHDMRHFTIVKTIEWEDANKRSDWRSEMAGLYSQIK